MENLIQQKNDIIHWLNLMNINKYIINDNLIVDVQGDVLLKESSYKNYIPIQFGVIHGHFCCPNLNLLSLKGSPHKVYGDFDCTGNKLTSLKGGPEEVLGNFLCGNNSLSSLKYSPRIVQNSFFCAKNNLTSLEYITNKIGQTIDCSNNNLITLKGCPDIINRDFNCSRNQLRTFEYFPNHVFGLLHINNNKIDLSELVNFKSNVKEHIFNDFGFNKNEFNDTVEILKKIKHEKIELNQQLYVELNNKINLKRL